MKYSGFRRDVKRHVLNFRSTSGHNVLYMRNDVSKEISRFRLLSSGRRRLLLKVPNFPQKTLKLGRVAFYSLAFQFQCLDFQSNRHTKLAPVPSRFCNGLLLPNFLALVYLQQYLSLYSQRLGYLPAKFEKLVSILNLES